MVRLKQMYFTPTSEKSQSEIQENESPREDDTIVEESPKNESQLLKKVSAEDEKSDEMVDDVDNDDSK